MPTVPFGHVINEYGQQDYNIAELDPPTLTAPDNGSTECVEEVDFEWDAVATAEYYILQICENSNFEGPTLEGYKVTGATTYTLEVGVGPAKKLKVGTQYYWRVFAVSNVSSYGGSPSSEIREFSIDCRYPESGNDGYTDDFNCGEGGIHIQNIRWSKASVNGAIVDTVYLTYDLNIDTSRVSLGGVSYNFQVMSGNATVLATTPNTAQIETNVITEDQELVVAIVITATYTPAMGGSPKAIQCIQYARLPMEVDGSLFRIKPIIDPWDAPYFARALHQTYVPTYFYQDYDEDDGYCYRAYTNWPFNSLFESSDITPARVFSPPAEPAGVSDYLLPVSWLKNHVADQVYDFTPYAVLPTSAYADFIAGGGGYTGYLSAVYKLYFDDVACAIYADFWIATFNNGLLTSVQI
jgi:hypothetical protein